MKVKEICTITQYGQRQRPNNLRHAKKADGRLRDGFRTRSSKSEMKMTFRTLLRVAASTGDDIPVEASLGIDCTPSCLYILLRRTAQNSVPIPLELIKRSSFLRRQRERQKLIATERKIQKRR